MKERLRDLLSEVGESFDYLRSDVRNLSRSMAELEDLAEAYRTFVAKATLSTPADRAEIRKLLKRTRHPFWVHRQTGNQSCLARMIRRWKGLFLALIHR